MNAPADSMQLLLAERRPSKDRNGPRLADVYHYDYRQNVLVHCVIHAETEEVLDVAQLPGVQLPLVEPEIDRAKFILMATSKVRREINVAYRQITGSPLRQIDQLNYKPLSFMLTRLLKASPTAHRNAG